MNKYLSLLLAAFLSVGLLAGCASTEEAGEPASKADAQKSAAEAAIAAADAAIKKAASVGGEWRDSRKILKKAEAALKKGDYAKAIKLANQARRQGELGYAQAMDEMEKSKKQNSEYSVVSGDSLWAISGKSEVYGNPYQWPLIYKSNRSQIKDADLIYPGQVFTIDRGANAAEIDAAIHHAQTRGAWSVGTVEESDLSYLNM
jgi:nucleoid-associated protein YgaU